MRSLVTVCVCVCVCVYVCVPQPPSVFVSCKLSVIIMNCLAPDISLKVVYFQTHKQAYKLFHMILASI